VSTQLQLNNDDDDNDNNDNNDNNNNNNNNKDNTSKLYQMPNNLQMPVLYSLNTQIVTG
jgi:hypothetical protein